MYFLPAVTLLILCTFPGSNIGCQERQCRVSQWYAWTSCLGNCDGIQTRKRHVIEHAYCGGSCPYEMFQRRECHCNHDSDDSHGGSSKGLHGGEIAGICVGCLCFFCFVCAALYHIIRHLLKTPIDPVC